jgi:hypothetical protein
MSPMLELLKIIPLKGFVKGPDILNLLTQAAPNVKKILPDG